MTGSLQRKNTKRWKERVYVVAHVFTSRTTLPFHREELCFCHSYECSLCYTCCWSPEEVVSFITEMHCSFSVVKYGDCPQETGCKESSFEHNHALRTNALYGRNNAGVARNNDRIVSRTAKTLFLFPSWFDAHSVRNP